MSHTVEEQYTIYDERRVRARIRHECDACDLPIEPGHAYMRIGILFDGEWETVKRCLRCQAIHEHLRELGAFFETWPAERLDCGEEYRAHWGNEPPPEIAALAFWRPGEPV